MKRFLTILALFIALLVPSQAHAMPNKWKGTPTFTRAGVTYRVRGRVAVVTKTKGKRVCIPAEVAYKGKHYEVRAIWSGALKGAKVVTIHADLETCESARLWSPSVRVRVTRAGMYRWLKRTGANVTQIYCARCK